MKIFLACGAFLLTACLSVHAQNIGLEGGAFGPQAILGYNNSGDLSTYGNAGVGYTALNDGQTTAGGDRADDFGQPNPADGQVGIVFATPVTVNVGSVTFYDASYFDGGWFGVNEKGPTGVDDSNPGYLSAAALIAPTLQVTYSANPTSGAAVWTDVSDTNNYVSAMTDSGTGAPYSTPVSTASTFKLSTPVTDITGIRLIGENGGYHSNGGGFLGAYEFEVLEAPEPSTYAMMLIGLGAVGFCVRRRLA
jgi:hypothetical protein